MGALVLLLILAVPLAIWIGIAFWIHTLLSRPDQPAIRRFANQVAAIAASSLIVVGLGFAVFNAVCSGSHL